MASSTIEQILYEIRHAIYGKDVRENIALGIEKCYEDETHISVVRIGQTADYQLVISIGN